MECEIDHISSSEESLVFSQGMFLHLFDALKGTGLDDIDCSIISEVNTSTNDEVVQPKPLAFDGSFVVKEEVLEVSREDELAFDGSFIVKDEIMEGSNDPLLGVTNMSATDSIIGDSYQFQEQQNKPSSLPAIQSWPGAHGFCISFTPQENISKKVAWVYSPEKSKLYVQKDAPCPINFSTSNKMPEGTFIRAMPLFCAPEHATQLVHRCYNHSLEDKKKGVAESDHLIRCECDSVSYEVDLHSQRQSVVVPFDNPAAGQQYSTYLFKFVCFGSCSGGPNRRPLMVVFTLEHGNQVLGRQSVDLKICACPARDRKNEEIHTSRESECSKLPLKQKVSSKRIRNVPEDINFLKSVKYPAEKKTKTIPNKDGSYVIAVKDKKMYKFLKHMKHFYEMCEMMKNAPPAITNQLYQLYMKTKSRKYDSD